MTAAARLRLVLAAAGIVPTAACGATPSRIKTTDTTAVVSPPPETTTTSADAVVPASASAGDTTTTTEAPVTVTIAAPPAAPAVPVFVMPEAETEETDQEWFARQPGYRTPTPRGDTPPEYIKQCESGGDYGAVNPNGHYGAWQFSESTWRSVGGTGRPDHASPEEQDRRAAILWDGGRGASHWDCG